MITDQDVERFFNREWQRGKRKFSMGDLMSKNNRLAARGESRVKRQIGALGVMATSGAHNDPFDLLASMPDRDLKIEVKTAQYRSGMYKFHIRKSTADFVVLACAESRKWWYLIIPGSDLAGVVGFSIRARKPDQYTGKFKNAIGRFDLISEKMGVL